MRRGRPPPYSQGTRGLFSRHLPSKDHSDACYATADGSIEITDPNNVPDVLINGPFNVMNTGGMVHITFTNVRPDDGDLFSGKNPPRIAWSCGLSSADAG